MKSGNFELRVSGRPEALRTTRVELKHGEVHRLSLANYGASRCQAVNFASEPVIELYRGEVAWDGVVETFDLTGHPKAKRCHAWSYEENGGTQFVTVLELPPVDSPETAVKVAIAAEARNY